MGDIEFLLLLLLAAALLIRAAELVSVPYPIVLVLGGLAIAMVPGLPELELAPEVVFLVFLPPLLHAAGWTSDPRADDRTELREFGAMRRELIATERAALLRQRNEDGIALAVVRRVERDLDLGGGPAHAMTGSVQER